MKQNPSVQTAIRLSLRKCIDCLFAIKIGGQPSCNRRLKSGPATHPLTGFPRRLATLRPHCEDERSDGDIAARIKATCGRSGRFYRPKPIAILSNPEPKPETTAHEKTEASPTVKVGDDGFPADV